MSYESKKNAHLQPRMEILESGIDVGQEINLGSGELSKKNEQNVQTYVVKKTGISVDLGRISKFKKRRAFR